MNATKIGPKNKLLIVAYGTMARICQTVIDELEAEEGISVGLFRPISLFPFPEKELKAEAVKKNIRIGPDDRNEHAARWSRMSNALSPAPSR